MNTFEHEALALLSKKQGRPVAFEELTALVAVVGGRYCLVCGTPKKESTNTINLSLSRSADLYTGATGWLCGLCRYGETQLIEIIKDKWKKDITENLLHIESYKKVIEKIEKENMRLHRLLKKEKVPMNTKP